MAAIKVGSHLITSRALYTHHGIYAGRNKVVHYSGLADQFTSGPIEVTTLESFSGGQDIIVRGYTNPKHVGESALERAKSRLGENKYDLHGNNCEHFCTWVITGRSNSKQVEKAEDFIDVLIPGVALISALKLRKHSKQGFDVVDVSKDVIDVGVKTAIMTVAPVTIPFVVGYKVLKWLFK